MMMSLDRKTNVEDFAPQLSGGVQVDLANVHGKELFKNTLFMVGQWTGRTNWGQGCSPRYTTVVYFVCVSQVYPVQGFPDPAISQASERIVREHQAKYSQDSRILQQVLLPIL